MSARALELRGVVVERGGRRAVAIEELRVEAGELVAIVGQNGSGKSTLLQAILGLLPVARGTVMVLGERLEPGRALAIRRRCALVFQDPLLLQTTVFDNVALAARFRGHAPARVGEVVERSLATFRCEHLASRPAHQLSGGEIRRVCLARALACDPELVMLDEPFSGLDPPTRSALVQELRDVALARGATAVLVTHDFDDVLSFAGRALVLREGSIVQDAGPEEVLRRPADAGVARLVAMDNVFVCEAKAGAGETRIRLPNGVEFAVAGKACGGEVTACLAGDALTVSGVTEQRKSISGGPVVLEGRVVHVVPGVGLHKATVDCGGMTVVVRMPRASSVRAGQRVHLAFDPSDVHLV